MIEDDQKRRRAPWTSSGCQGKNVDLLSDRVADSIGDCTGRTDRPAFPDALDAQALFGAGVSRCRISRCSGLHTGRDQVISEGQPL